MNWQGSEEGGTQISIVLGLFFISLFVAGAVGGLILVPAARRREHNDVAGFIYAAALALTIALVLFTIGALDYPFRGDVRVGPEGTPEV